MLGIAWGLAVAFLTLQPGGMRLEEIGAISTSCLFCGTRGTADAILNVALFMPLGFALGRTWRRVGLALVGGLLLSLGIEVAQLFLSGRHATVSDLLWNTSGAGVGALLHFALATRISARPKARALPWTMAAGLTLIVGGVMSSPSFTDVDYWGQWMPDLGYMPQYDGTVLSAELNGVHLSSWRFERDRPHREQVEGDWTLQGRIVSGPPPRSVSPVLSIYDGRQQEILLLGAHRDDLVLRERRTAADYRLDAPDVRVPGALAAVQAGDTVELMARRVGGSTCMALDASEWCDLGVTPGRTWGYLLYLEGPPEPFRRLVDVLWLIGLFLPVGFFARGIGELAVGVVLGVGGLMLAVVTTALIAGPLLEVVAVVGGVLLGHALVRLLESISQPG